MNIPKLLTAFIDLCPAKSRQALVFATYTHMSGNAVDTKTMSTADAELWRQALGILQPILAKREKARLYRQRRKARLQQTAQSQTTPKKSHADQSTQEKEPRSGSPLISPVHSASARCGERGRDGDNISREARMADAPEIAAEPQLGSTLNNPVQSASARDAAISELLEILDNLDNSDSKPNTSQPTMQYYKPGDIAPGRVVPNSRVEPEMLADIRDICRTYMPTTRHKAANERRVQTELRELYGEYFSHVCYFPDSGRMILYAAKTGA